MWVRRTHRNPRTTARVPVQVDRVGENGIGRKEIELVALGNLHFGEFIGDVRCRNEVRHLVLGVVVHGLPRVDPFDGIPVCPRDAQPGDAFLISRHEPVEVSHLIGEVAHLVGSEEENVGFVERPEPPPVLQILADDRSTEFLCRVVLRPARNRVAISPARSCALKDIDTIHLEPIVIHRRQDADLARNRQKIARQLVAPQVEADATPSRYRVADSRTAM